MTCLTVIQCLTGWVDLPHWIPLVSTNKKKEEFDLILIFQWYLAIRGCYEWMMDGHSPPQNNYCKCTNYAVFCPQSIWSRYALLYNFRPPHLTWNSFWRAMFVRDVSHKVYIRGAILYSLYTNIIVTFFYWQNHINCHIFIFVNLFFT